MNMNKRLEELEKAISPEPIIWDETKCHTLDQQLHPEKYKEQVVSQYEVGRVIFIEKELVKK